MHLRIRPTATALAIILPAVITAAGEGADDLPLPEVTRRISEAETREELTRACMELAERASNEQLRRLVAHPDPGVAFAAAWERVDRTVPEQPEDAGDDRLFVEPEDRVPSRPTPAMVRWFLGFVEGRLGVPLPGAWKRAMLGIEARSYTSDEERDEKRAEYRREAYHWARPEKREVRAEYVPPLRPLNRKGPYPSRYTKVRHDEMMAQRVFEHHLLEFIAEHDQLSAEDRGFWRVQHEGHTWKLPDRDTYGFLSPATAVVQTEKRTYIAIYDISGDRGLLYALNRDTERVLWGKSSWASGWIPQGGTTGRAWHNVHLRSAGGELFVFGTSSSDFYIEGYDAETGERRFRFGEFHLWGGP